ncbi:MAG: type II toxin-antitoxin system RelE/ParE family toxin [Patescibacteria group bacterium]
MEILKTDVFDKWLKKLKDKRTRAIIQTHINRLLENKLGKLRSLGGNIHEKKINYGPGYRLYFINHKRNLIILLCGGDKSTQQSNIKQAKIIAKKVKKGMEK